MLCLKKYILLTYIVLRIKISQTLLKYFYLALPKRCCPGSDLVKAMQCGFPLVAFTAGKYGSFLGTGIGQHSGWTVCAESQDRQFNMESGIPCGRNGHVINDVTLYKSLFLIPFVEFSTLDLFRP